MKYSLLIVFFILIGCKEKVIPQLEYAQLIITASYCKYDNDIRKLSPNFKLFKDGLMIMDVKEGFEHINTISNLKVGSYIIEYNTIYNHKNEIEINLSKDEHKTVSLCFDFLDYESNKNVLLIDELKNDESLMIYFQSMACFSGSEKELLISKIDNNFICKFDGIEYNLNNAQVKLIREFEIELRSNHSYDCSTLDNYELVNENLKQSYHFKDGSCVWKGFENLLKVLEINVQSDV